MALAEIAHFKKVGAVKMTPLYGGHVEPDILFFAKMIKFTFNAKILFSGRAWPSLSIQTFRNHGCKKNVFTFFILATFFTVFLFCSTFFILKNVH